ncbi:uncharacterized protein LOC108668052 [Hyalella azteca]|uniref:Uncharacterized protein LOC108668052 n=1 Tax=Hyalella azteca TaxID=294128 RepID=A0A8B7NAQ8_HYAAZ|nr:uncharacterized protein LOC108668052 [Hyalella azteca]
MVAVMIGTCGSGARNKFCASFLGEGAAVSRPPPTPAFVSSLRGCHQSSATSFGSSSSASRDWTVVNARKNLPTGMESDRVEYLGRESASLSPQGSNSALSPSYFDNPTSPISPGEGRRGELKQCGVCGDVAKSNHFGGRSCDSCKAFFRRSVQNNAYRGFNCPYEKKCVIAKTSRKACQYCRFHKCLAIGMEKSWVMSEAERRKMMEQRQERRIAAALQQQQQQPQQLQSTTQPLIVVAPAVASASIQGPGPTMNLVEEFVLSDEMKSEIEHIEEFYKQSYKANPYSTDIMTAKGSKGVLETWMQFCKKIGHFFSLFEDFSSLCQEDQAVLLQTAMTSAGIIMGSVTYESWIGKRKGGAAGPSIPKVSFDNIEKLVPGDLLYRVKTFFKKFQTICPDQTMAKILMLVSLYSPEMAGLKDETKVQTLQEHYINILSDYLKYKFGAKAGRMFANALVSLADVRELAERSLALEIKHSTTAHIELASSDSSSGGNSSARRGSGGGGLERPGMGEGSGASGSTGDFNHPSGGAGGSEGAGNREFDGVGGRGASCNLSVMNDPPAYSSFNDNLFLAPSPAYDSVLSDSPMDCDNGSELQPTTVKNRSSPSSQDRLAQRQQRIQELISSIPPPAIMKIIYHMSEDLDIEAKKTNCGIEFLRKNRSNGFPFVHSKTSNSSKKSNTQVEIKTENPFNSSFDSFNQKSISEVYIKEEKMELETEDTVDFDALKLLTKGLDVINPEIDYMNDGNFLTSQRHIAFEGNSNMSENSQNSHDSMYDSSYSRNRNSSVVHPQEQHQKLQVQSRTSDKGFSAMLANPSLHGSDLGTDRCPRTRRSMSPLNYPLATTSADVTVNGPPQGPSVYDSSLALVPSSRSDDDNRCRNVDGCPSPQLPFSNHFASTQGRVTNDKSANFPSGSFTNCHPPNNQVHPTDATRRFPVNIHHPVNSVCDVRTAPVSASLPVASSNVGSFSNYDESYSQCSTQTHSPNSFSYSDGKDYLPQQGHCYSSVQKQIMSMSLNSPSSSSENGSGPGNPANHMTHVRGYVTRFPVGVQPGSSLIHVGHSTSHPSDPHERLPDFSPNKSQQTRIDASYVSSDAPCPTPYLPCSPATPSPCPSVSSVRSSSSNSSSENSSDFFEKSLYNLPLNLSSLSDVETSVLQKFFERISAIMGTPRNAGKKWNSEDILPKSFLEMLQAELESERK